jgi:hypothetical protein
LQFCFLPTVARKIACRPSSLRPFHLDYFEEAAQTWYRLKRTRACFDKLAVLIENQASVCAVGMKWFLAHAGRAVCQFTLIAPQW